MKKWLIGAVCTLGMMAATSAHASESCGKVTIADMNWASASLMANVDKFILTYGYGCDAELIPGDTMPTGTSMVEKGQPDIAPEFWAGNFKAALAKGVEEKRLRVAGNALLDGGEEGFWVPKYMVDKDPSLATIEGLKANAKLFTHPEEPDKSALYTCPAGWGCQITNANIFRALKLEDAGFELLDPGSGAALAGAIAKAYERETPWVGYYWAPTSVLGKYKMVKVDFGVTDPEHFSNCLTQAECADPKPSMYPPSPVKTLTTEAFAERAPAAYAYLSKRGYKNELMNGLLAWVEDEQADGETAMARFMTTQEAVWSKWVPADVAAKLKKALADL